MKNQTVCRLVLAIILIASAQNAFAAGSGMPWEEPLYKILDSFTGPVAMILGTIAILVTGLTLALGEGGGAMRKILTVVFGLSITFTASSYGLSFFHYGGGAGF